MLFGKRKQQKTQLQKGERTQHMYAHGICPVELL